MKRLVIMLLACCVATGTVLAQTAPPAPAKQQSAAPPKHKRLVDVHDDLHLTAEQMPLWQNFIAALKASGKARHDAYLQSQAAPPDLPSRLAQYQQMLAVQQKSVDDEQKALTALWAVMSDQQKTVLNTEVTLTPQRQVRKRAPKPAAK